MKKRLEVNGFIMFIAILLIALFPSLFFREANPGSLEEAMEVVGIAFILSGQLLRASARGYKSDHSEGGAALINTGPYSLVRNPMYLGIFFIGLGIVLMLFKWWVAGIFLTVFIIRYIILIFKEERRLTTLFGEQYRTYKQKVPRLFPKISMLIKQDAVTYLPLKWRWVKREIGAILAVLLGVLFIESWEDVKNEGLAKYFKESLTFFAIIILFICLGIYLSRRTANFNNGSSDKSKNITK